MALQEKNKNILIFEMLKEKKYFFLAIFFVALTLLFYAFLQVLPQGLNNFWFWFTILTPFNWLLYITYGILSGLNISLFLWQKSQKTCPVPMNTKGNVLGATGALAGATTSLCSACFPWIAFVFPVSFSFNYSIPIMILSIILLFISLVYFGAFKRT